MGKKSWNIAATWFEQVTSGMSYDFLMCTLRASNCTILLQISSIIPVLTLCIRKWIKIRPFRAHGAGTVSAELVTGIDIASSSNKYCGKAHVQSSKSKKWQPGGSSSSNLIWTSDLEVIVQYEVMNHQEIPRALPTAPCRCIIHWLQLSETFGRTLYLRSED